LEKFSDNKIAQMLTGQKCSSDKTGLGYVATDSSNIASTSKTVFLRPSGSEPQNDKGKAIMVSRENDNTTPVKSEHSTKRSLPTCHHYGIVGHIRPNCGQLKFPRTWNKKNAPKKEKDVEEHSKTKYVPPHRRQLIQKFVPICHHCGLSGHIQPKCPHVLVQRSKVKEFPKERFCEHHTS
jgi:ribosomal protein L32